MTITILNGYQGLQSGEFIQKLDNISNELAKNHNVNHFKLHKMNLHYCTGCWSCWWKTPGECAIKDDAEQIFRSVIMSDIVIFASPLVAGFTSSTLKKITDRLIVLLHPYIELINGECHHRKRYPNYPDIALIIDKEPDTDSEDISIVNEIYDRFSLNFHCKRRFTKLIDEVVLSDIQTLEFEVVS